METAARNVFECKKGKGKGDLGLVESKEGRRGRNLLSAYKERGSNA